MYDHSARGPLNSFVRTAIKPQRLTCKHRPRITKINGEWCVFDGLGNNPEDAGVIVSTWSQAMDFAKISISHHKIYGPKECGVS